MPKFGHDVFVSYSSEDREFASQIVNLLRLSGFKIWIDYEQIPPGGSFRDDLEKGLRASRHLIALLTPAYTKRNWTQREVDLFDLIAGRTGRRTIGIHPDMPQLVDEIGRQDRRGDEVKGREKFRVIAVVLS